MSASFRDDWRRGSLVLATIFGIGIAGAVIVYLFTEATAAPTFGNVPPLCANDAQEAEKARVLIQRGLDNALVDHAQHLLAVWIRDNVNESQRARTGIENGVRAFLHAHRQIEAWDFPPCPK